ncbi:MAG: DUF885 domain-containing protein [Chloroflexi bacterium]|nr:DUF885 domain-containing protein [Chloroflexota bacterium]
MVATKQFLETARQHFEASYRAMPVQATTLGIHEYDHTLGDYTRSALQQNLHRLKQSRDELQKIDSGGLSLHDSIDLELVGADVQLAINWYEKTAEWKRNPNFYAELPVYGVFLLIVREFAPFADRMQSALMRIREVPDILQTCRDNVDNPPRVFTEVAVETTSGGIQFFEHLIPRLAARVPHLEKDLLSANARALAAYQDFLVFLNRQLLPRSQGEFAIGAPLFEERLRVEHMLDISASDLAALGKKVFTEVEAEMRQLSAQIGGGKSWPELVEEAKDEHPTGDKLLQDYRKEIGRLRSFIVENDLVSLSANERLEVVDTPVFARSTLPYAAYNPPAPFESDQKGQFWVTPLDTSASQKDQIAQLREHCYYSLPIIALHEAYPGHHLQLVRSSNVSSYVRKHIASNLMCEGWALYCEQLMGEVGYVPEHIAAATDNKTRRMGLFKLFVLKDALWRAARIMIDVGLHCQGMTIDEAVRLLVDRVHLSEAAALAEVRRYTASPSQPMSYTIGKIEILRLREELKGMGLRQFHDLLLASGTIPLRAVSRELMQGHQDT